MAKEKAPGGTRNELVERKHAILDDLLTTDQARDISYASTANLIRKSVQRSRPA